LSFGHSFWLFSGIGPNCGVTGADCRLVHPGDSGSPDFCPFLFKVGPIGHYRVFDLAINQGMGPCVPRVHCPGFLLLSLPRETNQGETSKRGPQREEQRETEGGYKRQVEKRKIRGGSKKRVFFFFFSPLPPEATKEEKEEEEKKQEAKRSRRNGNTTERSLIPRARHLTEEMIRTRRATQPGRTPEPRPSARQGRRRGRKPLERADHKDAAPRSGRYTSSRAASKQ